MFVEMLWFSCNGSAAVEVSKTAVEIWCSPEQVWFEFECGWRRVVELFNWCCREKNVSIISLCCWTVLISLGSSYINCRKQTQILSHVGKNSRRSRRNGGQVDKWRRKWGGDVRRRISWREEAIQLGQCSESIKSTVLNQIMTLRLQYVRIWVPLHLLHGNLRLRRVSTR